METKNEFTPKNAILPGSVLKLELEERDITQKNFADMIGMKPSNLNEYIRGKRSFTPEFSLKLEKELNISASFWMNLQNNYDLTVARKQQLDIKEQAADNELKEFDKIISVKNLTKRLNITSVSPQDILNKLKDALNLPSPAELQVNSAELSYFKKSGKLKADPRMVLTSEQYLFSVRCYWMEWKIFILK